MDIITDFEWFNDKGMVVTFDSHIYQQTPTMNFPNEFSYYEEENELAVIGVRWNYNGQPIVFTNVWYEGTLPTPNMDKVIVTTIELLGKRHSKLFGELHQKKYTTAIYNADGSVHKVVEMPYPIMPNLGRGPTRDEKPDTSEVYWCRKKVDGYSMLIRLGYYCGAWEVRYFNPETGEIGGLRSDKSYGYY
jgi:hypothetical protein